MKIKYLFWLFFIVAFFVLFLRRPDALSYAQFWAEDGRVWFANAYDLGGLKSLFLSQDGYFQTLSRITAVIALAVPIAKAPLVFNIIALLVQILPAWLIVSPRFEKLIPSLKVRLVLATLFLLLPNTAEVHGNITNAQWFLAISAFMVLIAETNSKKFWQIFDITILILAGLSGPFAILLSPIAFIIWFYRRSNQTLRNLLIIFSTAAVQIIGIFFLNHGGRLHVLPELTVKLIFAIFGRQVVWGSLIGANGYIWILNNITWYFWFFAITTFIAFGLCVYAVVKAPLELKLFLLFSLFVFAASLVSPTGDFSQYPALKLLSRATDGARYWLIPMVAFVATLVWGLSKKNPLIIRLLSGVFLVTMIFGIILDFQHPPFIDYHFKTYIEKFNQEPIGQKFILPINPSGWSMQLVKKKVD